MVRAREENKITLGELCKKTFIRLDRLQEIESGKINIRYCTMVRIAEVLQISLEELFKENKSSDIK